MAELLDITNNPQSHRFAMRRIMTVDNPAVIEDNLVDREQIALGGNRPVGYSKHLVGCMGAKFTRHRYTIKRR